MEKSSTPPATPNTTPSVTRPTAKVIFEPTGPRAKAPRDYSMKIEIALSTLSPKHGDKAQVTSVIHRAMRTLSPTDPSECRIEELVTRGKTAKDGTVAKIVIGVEGSVTLTGRPSEEGVAALRAALIEDGYRVATQERRSCAEPGCPSDALTDWGRPTDVPATWYSDLICGRHDYKSCVACSSIYVMFSSSSSGQAPSLHCEVCGAIMVEWGGSKAWDARLVKSGQRSTESIG